MMPHVGIQGVGQCIILAASSVVASTNGSAKLTVSDSFGSRTDQRRSNLAQVVSALRLSLAPGSPELCPQECPRPVFVMTMYTYTKKDGRKWVSLGSKNSSCEHPLSVSWHTRNWGGTVESEFNCAMTFISL